MKNMYDITVQQLRERIKVHESEIVYMSECADAVEKVEKYIQQLPGLETSTVYFSRNNNAYAFISVGPGFITGDNLRVKLNCTTGKLGNWEYQANKNIYVHKDLVSVFTEALENTKFAQATLDKFKSHLSQAISGQKVTKTKHKKILQK